MKKTNQSTLSKDAQLIYQKIFLPLMLYKPLETELQGWMDYLFNGERGCDVLVYKCKNSFKIQGRYWESPTRPITGPPTYSTKDTLAFVRFDKNLFNRIDVDFEVNNEYLTYTCTEKDFNLMLPYLQIFDI